VGKYTTNQESDARSDAPWGLLFSRICTFCPSIVSRFSTKS